ncbi:ClpXP protease specificity-enhancing factor [Parasulfuritortus cantonensis]|uniref:ClpXP protease specificity-enhancing factor n=1 Tax=Parasulfuritortus cantonensis TaxID=2528202 RepID=A0A4R1BA61_9PROT|nr:ClpXP protease specificity-enhancing factor [Parasulfuritortus cantonensis]TCJ13823.1 ClpXP protease specificity-enhancing factor [Parasulfuritortus cantonensis]
MSNDAIPQQPYFLRALYEWCVDSGYTPYITVKVEGGAKVPAAYVKDGQIVLNIGPAAVRNLQMDNDWLSFSARFGGVAQVIEVPVANVLAIYARETGDGMAFSQQATKPGALEAVADEEEPPPSAPEGGPARPKGKPSLRVVK